MAAGITAPLAFRPILMERVWGGRRLGDLFGRELPADARIGESWEIVDRDDAQSVVREGPLAGATLNELWMNHRAELFGDGLPGSPRFPLLFKLLDARERLSLQVHPPAHMAASLGGEPKTEMWFIVENDGDGNVYAGLRRGVSAEEFTLALCEGDIAEKVHEVPVKAGDAIFIPSGRVHAIGAGNVIVEVQQNSDTTYRVFDWNRPGLDGRPRELHIEESLQSIDFGDFEPETARPEDETLVSCEYFTVERWSLGEAREAVPWRRFAIFTCLEGEVECAGMRFRAGDFFLVPATLEDRLLAPVDGEAVVLRTTIPACGL